MNFAAINWLSISINLLQVVFVIVCLLMVLLVLMQRPKQEGLGAAFGAGVTDQVFGARTTNVLQRGTVYLASLFFLISLALAVLIGHENKKTGTLDKKNSAAKVEKAEPSKPEEPVKPKSLSEELPAETTPAIPVTPAPIPEKITPPTPTPAPVSPAPVPAPATGEIAPPAPAPAGDAPKPVDKPAQP
ncbi:MAG: preprotein translocase subunit SecG [Verrucomicrobiota bacterium]